MTDTPPSPPSLSEAAAEAWREVIAAHGPGADRIAGPLLEEYAQAVAADAFGRCCRLRRAFDPLRPAGALAVGPPFPEIAEIAGFHAFRVEEANAVEMIGDGA